MTRAVEIDSPLDPETVVPLPLTAWIPVTKPLRMPGWPADFDDCCSDLKRGMRGLLRHLDAACEGSAVWIESEKDVPETVMSLNKSAYSLPSYLRFLKIQCSYRVRAGDLAKSDGTRATLGDLVGIGASIFADIAHDVFLLASIAFPARFHTQTGRVFVGPNALNAIEPMPGFSRDNLYAERQLWPVIGYKSLTRVVNWEKRIGLFKQDVATTPLQRALACYTQLQRINFNDAYSMLFFAMQGLEAFYCRGFGDLRRQLAEKCRLFLGDWPTNKNIVGDLYNIRSSFVHGSYPICRANRRNELSDRRQKQDDAVADAAALAIRLLIASVHKCIDRRFTSVEFDWRVRTDDTAVASDE